jgi:hypothetical protein
MDLGQILGKMGISPALTQDISLLLVILVVSTIFGIFIGRTKLITVLINIYVAFAVVTVAPRQFFTDYTYELILFLVLVVGLTLIEKKLFEVYISGSGSGFLWRVFVMSFLEVVFFLSIIFSFVPRKVALGFISPTAFEYLTLDNYKFCWAVVPLIFLIFIHKKLNR